MFVNGAYGGRGFGSEGSASGGDDLKAWWGRAVGAAITGGAYDPGSLLWIVSIALKMNP